MCRPSPSSAGCRSRSCTTTSSWRWRRICGDGTRERTRAFTGLVSHYLFQDRFGRPGKGNDKGKVEGLVKFARSNFMTPVPVAASYEALNALLAERCRLRQSDRAGRHAETIGERLVADLAALRSLPGVALEPCETTHRAGVVDGAGPLPRQRLLGADGAMASSRCW